MVYTPTKSSSVTDSARLAVGGGEEKPPQGQNIVDFQSTKERHYKTRQDRRRGPSPKARACPTPQKKAKLCFSSTSKRTLPLIRYGHDTYLRPNNRAALGGVFSCSAPPPPPSFAPPTLYSLVPFRDQPHSNSTSHKLEVVGLELLEAQHAQDLRQNGRHDGRGQARRRRGREVCTTPSQSPT